MVPRICCWVLRGHILTVAQSIDHPGLSETNAPDGSQEVNGHSPARTQIITGDWSTRMGPHINSIKVEIHHLQKPEIFLVVTKFVFYSILFYSILFYSIYSKYYRVELPKPDQFFANWQHLVQYQKKIKLCIECVSSPEKYMLLTINPLNNNAPPTFYITVVTFQKFVVAWFFKIGKLPKPDQMYLSAQFSGIY